MALYFTVDTSSFYTTVLGRYINTVSDDILKNHYKIFTNDFSLSWSITPPVPGKFVWTFIKRRNRGKLETINIYLYFRMSSSLYWYKRRPTVYSNKYSGRVQHCKYIFTVLFCTVMDSTCTSLYCTAQILYCTALRKILGCRSNLGYYFFQPTGHWSKAFLT